MITWIKNNAIAFLLGGILFSIVVSFFWWGAHNISAAIKERNHRQEVAETNKLLSQCQAKPTNAITNEFNHEISKNKKGNIIIKTVPDIDSNMSLLQENIEEKHPLKKKDVVLKNKKQKGNW